MLHYGALKNISKHLAALTGKIHAIPAPCTPNALTALFLINVYLPILRS